METKIEEDLSKIHSMMTPYWKIQNNVYDKKTKFIYKVNSLDELMFNIRKENIDLQYALHRFYNFKTSKITESIFCEFGASPHPDEYNHEIDIYIKDIPYDVKLTVYPAQLSDKPYDLTTRKGKNSMIKWFYENQSQEGRFQNTNRIYVVCDGLTQSDALKNKSNFELIRKKVSNYMIWQENNEFNEVEFIVKNQASKALSELIYIN